MSLPPLWPNQEQGVRDVGLAIHRGERRICLSSPTGGGKTRMAAELIRKWLTSRLKVILYTNRRLLLQQLANNMKDFGFDYSIRMAGRPTDPECPLQIASIQTDSSRVHKTKLWDMHEADRVLVDECHLLKGPNARRLFDEHVNAGGALVGITATPLDLGGIYETLVVAGTTSELRQCGALVPVHHFGPDEPDLKKIKAPVGQDLTLKQNVQAMMRPGIFGRVLTWFQKLNPEHKPSILFAPGVAESRWFAEQFYANGITAAHIDGGEVWINGESIKGVGRDEARDQVLAASRTGRCKVLCNRFVLREGIDAPWLAHGIFATVFGSLGSYLQSGGRLLRASGSMAYVTLQDHGGNWWRHGSLNADRHWNLGDTSAILTGLREDRCRQKKEREPNLCPKCGEIFKGSKCPCGWVIQPGQPKSRPVVQIDGTLKEMKGDVFKPRRLCTRPDGPAKWRIMYYRAKSEKWDATFRQAFAMFAQENQWSWPDPNWPLMPIEDRDAFRRVSEVPTEALR